MWFQFDVSSLPDYRPVNRQFHTEMIWEVYLLKLLLLMIMMLTLLSSSWQCYHHHHYHLVSLTCECHKQPYTSASIRRTQFTRAWAESARSCIFLNVDGLASPIASNASKRRLGFVWLGPEPVLQGVGSRFLHNLRLPALNTNTRVRWAQLHGFVFQHSCYMFRL